MMMVERGVQGGGLRAHVDVSGAVLLAPGAGGAGGGTGEASHLEILTKYWSKKIENKKVR